MHLGINTPALTLFPGAFSAWEETAGIDDIAQIAVVADRLGYNHLTCSEHIAVPTEIAASRGGTYWDPLATFGYLAALTTRVKLLTQVLVLGYHHPLEIAKRYGTLDMVSRGRLVLGLGVGSLREEFELLGVPFEDRGIRADDALGALRASLSGPHPTYRGTHYEFSELVVRPHAVQNRVPLWIGGRTRRSLRRAIEHGDGWVPFGLTHQEVAAMLATVVLPRDFAIALTLESRIDPIADRTGTARALDKVAKTGATVAGASIHARDVGHYCEQLESLREIAVSEGYALPVNIDPVTAQ